MNMLVIVLSSQLLYYLLITQTGVVGAFDSHIHDLYTLPIGGVIGSIVSAYWKHHGIKQELFFMFVAQIILSWFYPDYSLGLLLVLGFIVGYTTPLMLYVFREQSRKCPLVRGRNSSLYVSVSTAGSYSHCFAQYFTASALFFNTSDTIKV